jgi:hypothetical protein
MDNVINLFSRRSPAKTRASEATQQSQSAAAPEAASFTEVAERNRVNQLRLRKEREQANRNVLKSYRIK